MATNNFLSTKAFHPGSKANRTKVFLAEQKAAEEQKKAQERQSVLSREQEHFARVQSSGHNTSVGQLAFMYAQPRLEPPTAADRRREEAEAQEQARVNETRLKKGAGDDWCTRCNVRGHVAQSLACPLRDADSKNPFQARLEDPHTMIEMRKRQLRQEGAIDASAVLTVTFQRKVDPNDPNNQLIDDPEDDVPLDEDELVEKQFLASLSAEDKKLLIKHFETEKKQKKKQKKAEKKEKKKSKKRQKIKTEKE